MIPAPWTERLAKTVQRLGLNTRYLYGLAGTGLLVVAVLLARFVYLPVLGRVAERQGTLRDLRVKLADVHVATERLPQEERRLEEVREHYQLIERRIGQGQSMARILEALNVQAQEHRLQLAAVQPRAEETPAIPLRLSPEITVEEIPLTLQLTGRYRHLAEFLGALQDAPFVSSVKQLAVTRLEAGSPKLRADVVLAVYVRERESSAWPRAPSSN